MRIAILLLLLFVTGLAARSANKIRPVDLDGKFAQDHHVASQAECAGIPPPVVNLQRPTSSFVRVSPYSSNSSVPIYVLIHNVTLIDPSQKNISRVRLPQHSLLYHGPTIVRTGPASSFSLPNSTFGVVLDYSTNEYSLTPGLVGLHEHLFYPIPGSGLYSDDTSSFPALYLAAGVTTARTTGSMHPYSDLFVTNAIAEGNLPGPRLLPTAPYVNGESGGGGACQLSQFANLTNTQDVASHVSYWMGVGFTNIKLYLHLTPPEAKIAINTAHKLGGRVTGHICMTSLSDASNLGIDCLEHGPIVSSDLLPPNLNNTELETLCCGAGAIEAMAAVTNVTTNKVLQQLIRTLIDNNTTLSSTLAVFESLLPSRPPLSIQRDWVEAALLPPAWSYYMGFWNDTAEANSTLILKAYENEAWFEREFMRQGGLLVTGADPTAAGGVIAGAADLRNLELLVQDGGFTPVEALQISSSNGARYLEASSCLGTMEAGSRADLILVDGDPTQDVSVMRNGVLVFKDGYGFDPVALRNYTYASAPVTWA